MRPIELILNRLEKTRQRQEGQWSARCPAHHDKTPSLAIRENPDGSVSMHCFAQCPLQSVLESIGIEMHQLYPPRQLSGKEPKRKASLLTASQALELLLKEARVIYLCAHSISKGKPLSEQDAKRCLKASGRIAYVINQIKGN